MSNFIENIKIATENIVLCSGTCSKKEHYEYAEKMAKVLKQSLIKELNEMIDTDENTNELLEVFIQKLEK